MILATLQKTKTLKARQLKADQAFAHQEMQTL